ncbi:hypothetical protein OH77DRAFT_1522645 [Trametes cingulata]|nr:hypothetical protein OH77DRAFT_1522645 [Trametes cingulata]
MEALLIADERSGTVMSGVMSLHTMGKAILQDELRKQLPLGFVAQFTQGVEIAYSAIPAIPTLEVPLRSQVREAFAASLSVVWKAIIGFSAAGLLSLLLLREVPMQKHVDEAYGLQERSTRLGAEEDEPTKGPTDVEITAITQLEH